MSHSNFRRLILLISIVFSLTSCNNLGNGEIAMVDHTYSGCFGGYKNRITLYEHAGETFAKLETDGKLVQDIQLSKKKIDSFKLFIKELKNLKQDYGCTSVENYILYTRSEIIKRTDGGCSWNGFENLCHAIFGKEK